MSLQVLKEIRTAVANLNPSEVQAAAERPVSIGLVASSASAFEAMEEFLLPLERISYRKRAESSAMIRRAAPGQSDGFDIILCEQGLRCPENAFTLYADEPAQTIREILRERDDLGLALARNFYAFRQPVVDRIIHSVSRENALFAVVTALPDIIPSFLELPWSIGEFASDTAFLTINQIRMAFTIAAASDKTVGYSLQRGEIATIGPDDETAAVLGVNLMDGSRLLDAAEILRAARRMGRLSSHRPAEATRRQGNDCEA